MKKKLLISFSGGRTSAYMLWFIINQWELRDEYEVVVVFANTGLEDSETLVFVHRCSTEWNIPIVWVEARHLDDSGNPFSEKGWSVKHQVVNFFTAAKNPFKGVHYLNPSYWKSEWSWTPFEEMISVLGIPSTNAPFCSDQLKRKAIESYLNSIGWKDYWTAIGMRYDEPKRLKKNAEEKRLIYVLVDFTVMAKYDILEWWSKNEFNLKVDDGFGNCNNCWKKSLKHLVNNYKKRPYSFDWWQHITDTYGYLNPRNSDLKPPFNFFRGNLSPRDIKLLAEKNYVVSQDVNDGELGCSESCEAF